MQINSILKQYKIVTIWYLINIVEFYLLLNIILFDNLYILM
jgi:hypothetical protein